jgi:hypothetical protein
MIFTNLVGPVGFARLRIRENPFGINVLHSFSMPPKNHGQVTIHRERFCGTFRLGVFHIAGNP